MHKHRSIAIIILMCVVAIPFAAHAAFTQPFGGKILSVKIPTVTCFGTGTGPIVLLGNLISAGATISSAGHSASSTINGVYGAIPFYATNTQRVPRSGQWILGMYEVVPNFSTCNLEDIPFPVKKTSNYNVSSGSNLR